ncbi:MAG: ABC transporter ATP-binding protein [Bosea sp.]|nr:ABC transporter ATP-binding protein [Bosea sp. (in: a-proteobacteria)]
MDKPLLSVRDLTVTFPTRAGPASAVDGVSFDLAAGEVLGIVGESGSGKSLTALSILRLIARPGRIAGGAIVFEGRDLLAESESAMARLRGASISMIFQEPMSSLNPVFPIGDQIMEPLRQHRGLDRRAARLAALELLDMVEIPDARRRLDEYPHQLSGGMRQRVMIAMALACRPKLLIADEPTTALDVTIQAQILDLLGGLQHELGMAVLLITHDLGVVAQFARRALVMYAGRVVESAPVRDLFRSPAHPYTRGLVASMPVMDGPRTPLQAIAGSVPQAAAMPPGCRFAPRCAEAHPACAAGIPPAIRLGAERNVACLLHAAGAGAA